MEFSNESFAASLRSWRARVGITREELSERTGISATSLGCYEHGVYLPNLKGLVALCQALGCTPDDLVISE